MTPSAPTSPRLRYRAVRAEDLETFHDLLRDPHVRRYLLDGEEVSRAWAREALEADAALRARTGLGMWLLSAPEQPETPIGFAGFRVFPELGPEAHLLYAFREPHTGRGLATEAARAMVRHAREIGAVGTVVSAVDHPNLASIRVLEKLGFRRTRTTRGAFGDLHWFALEAERDPGGAW